MRIDHAAAAPAVPLRATGNTAATPTPGEAASAIAQPGRNGRGGADHARQVEDAVKSANQVVQQVATNLKFETDKSTGEVVVRVIDSETQKVLRQMPSEEMLAVARSLDRMRGLILNRTA